MQENEAKEGQTNEQEATATGLGTELTSAHIAEGIRRFELRQHGKEYPHYLHDIGAALANSKEWIQQAETMLRILAKMKRHPEFQTPALMLQCFAVGLEVGRAMGECFAAGLGSGAGDGRG